MAFIANPINQAENLKADANANAINPVSQGPRLTGAGAGGGARGMKPGGSPFVNIQRYLMANAGDQSTGQMVNKSIEEKVNPELSKAEGLQAGAKAATGQAGNAQAQTNQIIGQLGGAEYGQKPEAPRIFNPAMEGNLRVAETGAPSDPFAAIPQYETPELTEGAMNVGSFTGSQNYTPEFSSGLSGMLSEQGRRPASLGETNLTAGLFGLDPNAQAIKERGAQSFSRLRDIYNQAPQLQAQIDASRAKVQGLQGDIARAQAGDFANEAEKDAFYSQYMDPAIIKAYRKSQNEARKQAAEAVQAVTNRMAKPSSTYKPEKKRTNVFDAIGALFGGGGRGTTVARRG